MTNLFSLLRGKRRCCAFFTSVLMPTLSTWGRPVKKSRIQLQREVFSPRVLSLLMSYELTTVLNAEL